MAGECVANKTALLHESEAKNGTGLAVFGVLLLLGGVGAADCAEREHDEDHSGEDVFGEKLKLFLTRGAPSILWGDLSSMHDL